MRHALPILAVLSLACGTEYQQPRTPAPTKPHLTVLTYNINFGIPGDEPTLEAIRQAGSDVAFLQETTAEWEAALRPAFASTFPHMAFKHCCGAGGLAVLSKHSFTDQAYLQPPEGGWFPGWIVVIDSPLGKLQVLNVHLRPQLSESGSVVSGYFSTPKIREEQIERYAKSLDPSLPTLVVGDFNEGSGGQAIGYLSRRGFRSALPDFAGSEPTWRWPTSVMTVQQQLDHIVHDERLDALDVRVLVAGRSDHLPVVGIFQLR